jgi:RNA polymerase sigma-70 factor (ECF subfamily)
VSDPLAALLERCRQGDTEAFAELVAKTQNGVYNLAYSVFHNRQEAEDMTQEVYLRVWRALPSFRGEAKFSTWLYRLAINACLNRRRQLRAQLQVVDDERALALLASDEPSPSAVALSQERDAALWAEVDRLPEKYRLVITLFYQQDLSYQEIAALLGLPLGTVKAHLNRARQALAARLNTEKVGHVPL